MRNKSLILMTICAALSTGLSAQSVYPGQHAGKMFVSTISKYSCGFDVESGYSCVDGKSLVGLFSLDISKPLQLTINDGDGEIEDVLRDIQEFMEY